MKVSNSIGQTRYQSIYLSQMELPFSRCVTTDFLTRRCREVPLSFVRATDRAWRPVDPPIVISDDDEGPTYTSVKLTRPGTAANNFKPQSKFFCFLVNKNW